MDKPEEFPDDIIKPKIEIKDEPLVAKETKQENLSNEDRSV